MKNWLRTRKLESLINKSLRPDIGWREINKVLIIYNLEQNPHKEPWLLLSEILREKQVEVVHFGFDGRKEAAKVPPQQGIFTTQDFNWLGFPKENVVQMLQMENPDLCIDIVEDAHHPMTFLSLSLGNVPVAKIGATSLPYHLQIQPKENNIREAILTFIHILTASKNLRQ